MTPRADTQAALDEKRARLAMVNELRESPAYRAILLPHFQQLAMHHSAQCRNRDLSAEKRAEHIEAADVCERLQTYLDERASLLESQIESLRAKVKK